ncbi:hypothetical protein TWF569_000208 [Orbilia oligospora]|nr:hypothetical protein TWF569_000208 [Orbilia oligospora]
MDEAIFCILGRMGQHNNVVVCLRVPLDATEVFNCLTKVFPSIRLNLIVGFASGVPHPTDIRLGDVVVGTKVMQCDGHAVYPSRSFDIAISALKRKHELGPSRIPSIMMEKLGKYPNFGRPESPDNLFSAGYRHMTRTADGASCNKIVFGTTARAGVP